MLRLGKERAELQVVYDQIGAPTYARDLAGALLTIIAQGEQSKWQGVYNYSNTGVTSWFDFANAIFDLSDISCKVNPILSEAYPTPAPRPNFSLLDTAKIRKTFSLAIPHWRSSLKDCLEQI